MAVERRDLVIIGFNSRPFLDVGVRTPIVHSSQGDLCFKISSDDPAPIPRYVYEQLLKNGQVTGIGTPIPISPDRLSGEDSPMVGYLSRNYKGVLAALADPDIQVTNESITTLVYANRKPITVRLTPLVKMVDNVDFWVQPAREVVPMLLVWGGKLKEQFDRSWDTKTKWEPDLVRPLHTLSEARLTEVGYWEAFVIGIRDIATAVGNRDLRYDCAIREFDILDFFPGTRNERLKAYWLKTWKWQIKDFDEEKFYKDLEDYRKYISEETGFEPNQG